MESQVTLPRVETAQDFINSGELGLLTDNAMLDAAHAELTTRREEGGLGGWVLTAPTALMGVWRRGQLRSDIRTTYKSSGLDPEAGLAIAAERYQAIHNEPFSAERYAA